MATDLRLALVRALVRTQLLPLVLQDDRMLVSVYLLGRQAPAAIARGTAASFYLSVSHRSPSTRTKHTICVDITFF